MEKQIKICESSAKIIDLTPHANIMHSAFDKKHQAQSKQQFLDYFFLSLMAEKKLKACPNSLFLSLRESY